MITQDKFTKKPLFKHPPSLQKSIFFIFKNYCKTIIATSTLHREILILIKEIPMKLKQLMAALLIVAPSMQARKVAEEHRTFKQVTPKAQEITPGFLGGDIWYAGVKGGTLEETLLIEIRNKSSEPIYVDIDNAGNRMIDAEKINPNKGSSEQNVPVVRFGGKFDLSKPTIISIFKSPKAKTYEAQYYIEGNKKNIYVSWEKKELRPQQGKGGKTQSGLSLKNNVKKADLRKVN